MRIVISRGGGTGAKIGATLFGLVFAGFGVFFIGLLGRMMLKSYASWFWPAAECTIDESRFVDQRDSTATNGAAPDQPFRFVVRYRYDWQGSTYTGDVYRRGYVGGDDPAEAERLAARYPVGTTARCYVDPKTPATAVLGRPPLAALLIVLFPLLFVGFGAFTVIAAWWSPRSTGDGPMASATPALGRPDANRWKTFGCASAFFGTFAVFGLGFFIPFFGIPMWRVAKARGWNEVPCTVLESSVGTHSSSKGGPTYSIDVLFSYEVDGHDYKGNHYDLMSGSSSGSSGKEAVIATLPASTVTRCYVNPDDPTDAVINRSFSTTMWVGLLPLVFVAVGVGGIAISGYAIFKRDGNRGVAQWLPGMRGKPAATSPSLGVAGAYELADDPFAPRVLKPAHSSLGKVGCAAFLAIFVGGLVGTFVWKGVVEPLRSGGRPDGCMMVVLVPFALIAIGLIVNLPYQMLAFFNPRSHLELVPGTVQPGRATRLRWRFTGLAARLSRVEIGVEGVEEASHRVGTTTRTDRSTFFRQVLVDTSQAEEIANGGEATLNLPANAVHSFSASHNKISYKLKLHGTVNRWPDVMDEYTLEVAPEENRP